VSATSSVAAMAPARAAQPIAVLARVYLGALVLVGIVAVVVAIVAPGTARLWLRFTFPGYPATMREAFGVFAHNAVVATVPIAAATLAASGAGRTRRLLELALLGLLCANVLVVGAGLGAYGGRMVGELLPHAPLELLGYAQTVTVYLLARRGALRARVALALTGAALLTLLIAAFLETFAA
jgi:hypothetical protein